MRKRNSLCILGFLLCFYLLHHGCTKATLKQPPISQSLTQKAVPFKNSVTYVQNLENIESLIIDGLYYEALVLINPLLSDFAFYYKNPGIFNLTADALKGIGRNSDAKFASDIAKWINNYKIENNEEYKKTINELNWLISTILNSPADTLAQSSSKSNANKKLIDQQRPDPLITNSFFETDLRQVLLDLSLETEIQILWDANVNGMVTYEAQDIPLSKILEDILFPTGFVYVYRDSTYYVGSADVESPSFNKLSDTYTFQLTNMIAKEAVQLLPESFSPYVRATNSLNLVCITAPPSLASRIIKDLKAIDAPVPQVEIEVVVVEFSTSDIRKLGIDWSLSSLDWNDKEANFSVSTPEIGDAVLALDYLLSSLKIGNKAVDLATSLKALEDAGAAKIRATPRLRTLNGRTATLETLKEQYFMITGGEPGQFYGYYNRLETIQSGIHLMITPYADTSGYITVSVKTQVDDVVGEGASGLPEISRRTANTTVRVKAGETITIGGLRLNEKRSIKRRIPILGSIPILGFLFGRTEDEVIEKELV